MCDDDDVDDEDEKKNQTLAAQEATRKILRKYITLARVYMREMYIYIFWV